MSHFVQKRTKQKCIFKSVLILILACLVLAGILNYWKYLSEQRTVSDQ